MIERITDDTPEVERHGHEFRYHLAKGFLEPTDKVVDAACGSGYGADILCAGTDIEYIGYDIFIPQELRDKRTVMKDFIPLDLCAYKTLSYPDVFIGFETIEHLCNYDLWVEAAKTAGKWIIVSAPVIPTKHANPYHLHDFEPGDLAKLFVDGRWEEYQTLQQPSEQSEISIFRRRSV